MELEDLEYLADTTSHETMTDCFTGIMIPTDVWFLRYGIRDPTLVYFNGDLDDDTFVMTDTDLSGDDSTIDSVDEAILTGQGTWFDPIDLTDSDLED